MRVGRRDREVRCPRQPLHSVLAATKRIAPFDNLSVQRNPRRKLRNEDHIAKLNDTCRLDAERLLPPADRRDCPHARFSIEWTRIEACGREHLLKLCDILTLRALLNRTESWHLTDSRNHRPKINGEKSLSLMNFIARRDLDRGHHSRGLIDAYRRRCPLSGRVQTQTCLYLTFHHRRVSEGLLLQRIINRA